MSSPVVVYIGGCGRSGSTLLDRLLGQTAGLASVGELFLLVERGFLDDDTCGCGRPFSTCEFWTEVVSRTFGADPATGLSEARDLQRRVDRNRFVPRLALPWLRSRPASRDTREYRELLGRLYAAIAEVAGAPVVVDSSKHVSTGWLLRRSGTDIRLIHLIRDARGMAYSWTKAVAKPESRTGAQMDRFPPRRSALRWLAYNVSFEILGRAGVPATRLFYEDLVNDPEGELRRVFAALRLPFEPDLGFLHGTEAHLGFTHTVAGNPMRFQSGRVALRVDDEWRRAMPSRQRRIVTGITAPLLAGYGYLGGRRG